MIDSIISELQLLIKFSRNVSVKRNGSTGKIMKRKHKAQLAGKDSV